MGTDFWDSVVQTLRERMVQEVVRSEETQRRLTPRVIMLGGWVEEKGRRFSFRRRLQMKTIRQIRKPTVSRRI